MSRRRRPPASAARRRLLVVACVGVLLLLGRRARGGRGDGARPPHGPVRRRPGGPGAAAAALGRGGDARAPRGAGIARGQRRPADGLRRCGGREARVRVVVPGPHWLGQDADLAPAEGRRVPAEARAARPRPRQPSRTSSSADRAGLVEGVVLVAALRRLDARGAAVDAARTPDGLAGRGQPLARRPRKPRSAKPAPPGWPS